MSAADYYQPHVYIDGQRLSESAALDGLTPVADIRIKWGARDWWPNVEPSTARLTILDPRGELLSLKRGMDVRITVDPNERTIFRGTLDASTARFTHRTNRHGTRVPLWEVSVEAFDPLAALEGDRAHGPSYPARNGQQNLLHWGRSLIWERLNDLQSRIPVPLDAPYPAWCQAIDDATAPNATVFPVAPYSVQQNVSVLHVLRKSARILHPLSRPYFDHATGTIRLLRPQAPQWLTGPSATAVAAGMIRLTRTGGPTVGELNGSYFSPSSGALQLDLRPQDNLTFAKLLRRYEVLNPADSAAGFWGTHYEILDAPGNTYRIGGESEATVELETDLAQYAAGEWPVGETGVGGIGTLMRATHDWRALPRLRFRLRKTGPADEFEGIVLGQRLFQAAPAVVPGTERIAAWTLVDTPLQWAGTLPYFSVVGGELRYTSRAGWVIDCNPATVPTEPDTGTTLGDITIDVPISNTAPDLTVGDFQLI